MDWLLILAGLVTLLVSADLLVRGSVAIAIRLGIRPMLVGLTVVAFGTSAPELAASLAGAFSGESGLATGTVLGSNVANLALILGSVALVTHITYEQGSARFEMGFLAALTVLSPLPMILLGEITRVIGCLLLVGITWFTWRMIAREGAARRAAKPEAKAPESSRMFVSAILAITGLAGLYFGAEWLVSGARAIATAFGISPQVIGATVIAVGTSLPELAASVVAAYRKHAELALGNVLGSNIFNFCMVLGTTAAVHPLPMTWNGEGLHVVAGILVLTTVGGLLHFKGRIHRPAGLLLVLAYATYLATSVIYG